MDQKDSSGGSKNMPKSQTEKAQDAQVPKGRRPRGNRPLRFACPPSITSIKHRLILDAFTTIFEQFPRKITELKALKNVEQHRVDRSDIFTDSSLYSTPPPLRSVQEEQENGTKKEETQKDSKSAKIVCNCNRQSDVFLTYDGFIKANSNLVGFVAKLEAYYDFYSNWWIQFNYAVQLMKPEAQDESHLEAEIQEATMAALAMISNKISG